MRRTAALLSCLLALVASSWSQGTASSASPIAESYLGIFAQDKKVGYTATSVRKDQYQKAEVDRSDSKTFISIGLIETPVVIRMESTTLSKDGKPLLMKFRTESAGRVQTLQAEFGPTDVALVVNNNGAITKQRLAKPKEGKIVDDPVNDVLNGPSSPGALYWVLDPTTASFVKNTVTKLGKISTNVRGKVVEAEQIEITDPRVSSFVYLVDGEVVKIATTVGLEMYPMSKEEALLDVGGANPDLAELTAIRPNVLIENASQLTQLKIKLTGAKLPPIPSDEQQNVKVDKTGTTILIKPLPLSKTKTKSIATAGKERKEWLKPSLHMPANSRTFVNLAKQIVGKRTDVKSAALAIRKYVHQIMKPNAGIGVLRDASEVLRAKEGVCRDYAILTTTLCRAAGIPARLASGLVSWDGTFYYHAWTEVWTGFSWMSIDSTAAEDRFSASHVKLSQGNVDTAFSFTILSGIQMEVLLASRD